MVNKMEKKKVLKKMKEVGKAFLHINKYIVVLVVGIVVVGFLGDNSIVAHFHNKSRINELKAEIAEHQSQTAANLKRIHLLDTDKKEVERVAREQHFMKMPDEDVFVLSDDVMSDETIGSNESVE